MIRKQVDNVQFSHRKIAIGSPEYKEQVAAWTQRILNREDCVPDGYVFTWRSGASSASNTALLFDAAMVNVQYAQHQLQLSTTQVGKQAFATCVDAARAYKHVIEDIMPQWTFRPCEVYNIPDARTDDLYGHYFLARAMAYANVGIADLQCPESAQLVAYSNAAHLYAAAAQLICGDTAALLHQSQQHAAKVLQMRGEAYLQAWDADNDDEGAAKALACFQEAHVRLVDSGHPGCADRVQFATERNSVHWLKPVLPAWKTLLHARVTALH